MQLTYRVCNRCENSVAAVHFGLEAPVNLVAPSSGSEYESSSGEKWDVSVSTGNRDQLPAFRALTMTPKKNRNGLHDGACDQFVITVSGWSPNWEQNFLMEAGQYYDNFVNVPVGLCECPDCTPLNPCPAGFSGDDCSQCEDTDQWTWWCIPDGGDYSLIRLVSATPPSGSVRAGTVDSDGYQLTCDCLREYLPCCPDCALCDDATGTCLTCANPAASLDQANSLDQCCTPPPGEPVPCAGLQCGPFGVCNATANPDGECECVQRADGTTYGADPTGQSEGECVVEVEASLPYRCSDFDCANCPFAVDWAVPTGCEFCNDECRPAGACESNVTECAVGALSFAPGYCPNACSGNGQCNTTSGACICANGVEGLNCGSKNGLSSSSVALIASGGVIAGIVVGSFVLALIVFGVFLLSGYGAFRAFNAADFHNNIMADNPMYEDCPGHGTSAIHEPAH